MPLFKKSLPLTLILSATVTLSGCQNLGLGTSSSSDADPLLNSGRQAQFFSESGISACLTGGLAGAATGAIIGLTTGGDSKATAIGAAAGAAAGCGIGLGANYYFEQQRAKYANKEDRLNAEIKDLKETNAVARETISVAKNVLNKDKKTLAALNKQIKNKSVQQANAKKELNRIDANLKTLNERLSVMKKKRDTFKDVAVLEKREGSNVKQLDAQISTLNKQIAELEGLITSASKQRTAIKLG